MTTKTFKTYGKRSTRTVVTPLISPLQTEASDVRRHVDHQLSPSLSSTGASEAGGGADESGEFADSPSHTRRPGRRPGLNRRKPHEHFVTPNKRGASSLPLASGSRSVTGHKRLRAFRPPTKGSHRLPAASEYPAKSNTIRDVPSPLREADVNRIHVGQFDSVKGSLIPDGNTQSVDRPVSPAKRVGNCGSKDNPIDLSGNDGNDEKSNFPKPPLARKKTGSKRTKQRTIIAASKDRIVSGPSEAAFQRGHTTGIPHGQTTSGPDQLPSRGPPTSIAGNSPVPDSPVVLSTSHVWKLQHGIHQQGTPPSPHNPVLTARDVHNRVGVEPRRNASFPVPPSPATSNGEFNDSKVPTPRYTPLSYAFSRARVPVHRRLSELGSSPFPVRRRDSPIIRRGINTVVPSFDELLSSFSDLSFSISIAGTPVSERPPVRPTPFSRLLKACHQEEPVEFTQFVQDFPQKYYEDPVRYRKVGEATYSEVYGVGDIVIKIVPLLADSANGSAADDRPPETPIEDALREILFISRMGSVPGGSGFVGLLGAEVVRGPYAPVLLSEWDEWDAANRSESIRPGCFPPSQLYAVIEMSYSGIELEKYKFPKKAAWQQAASVFWQVARSLERAETHLQFEHRDLHWGQVLILPVTHAVADPAAYMDDPGHGVAVTIIDFGFSRMDGPNPGDHPLYTPFEPEIFEGEGDYQYDIYRMMRDHNGDEWAEYRPMTNLMWLHYLTTKLIKSKGLRKPAVSKAKARSSVDHETLCYNSLVEAEEMLRAVVRTSTQSQPGGKQRRTTVRGVLWKSAADMCSWARGREWIN